MLICQIAFSIFKIGKKIARIRSQDYLNPKFSLVYNKENLPIDVIKIDKLFIAHASKNSKYLKILNSITELAHKLNLKIVAEGVEDIEQFELVKELGVLCVQGYLVSRPESSTCVDTKVLNQNINRVAITGTSVWGIENK